MYRLTEKEYEEWEKYSHISGSLDNCAKVGKETNFLQAEWGQHLEK